MVQASTPDNQQLGDGEKAEENLPVACSYTLPTPDEVIFQWLETICIPILNRREPHIVSASRVREAVREARGFVRPNLFNRITPEDTLISLIKWASLYAFDAILPFEELPRISKKIPISAAHNILEVTAEDGESGSIYPAICPTLTLEEAIASLCIYADSAEQIFPQPKLHPLSLNVLAKLAGCPITSHIKDGEMVISFINDRKKVSPQAALLYQGLKALSQARECITFSKKAEMGSLLHGQLILKDAQIFIDTGVVYIRARRDQDSKYKNPASTITIPYDDISPKGMVLQIGLQEAVDPVRMISRFFEAFLFFFDDVLGNALERAYNDKARLSAEIREIITGLVAIAEHDLRNANTVIVGSFQLITKISTELHGKLTAKNHVNQEEITKRLLEIMHLSKSGSGNTQAASVITKKLVQYAKARAEIAEPVTITLLDAITSEIELIMDSLRADEQDLVHIEVVTEESIQDPRTFEFSGSTEAGIGNLVTNALKVWRQAQDRKTELDNLDIGIIVSQVRVEGDPYFLVTFVDNGPGFEGRTIEKILSGSEVESTTEGSGIGLRLIRRIACLTSPSVPPEQVFRLSNGIPPAILNNLATDVQAKYEKYKGACISIMLPQATTVSP